MEKRLKEYEAKIAQLYTHIHQAMADLNIFKGAREECLFWISKAHEISPDLEKLKQAFFADKIEILDVPKEIKDKLEI